MSERRKALKPNDGIGETLLILDTLKALASGLESECHLAFLGIVKAFDCFSRDTIRQAMEGAGVPGPFMRT